MGYRESSLGGGQSNLAQWPNTSTIDLLACANEKFGVLVCTTKVGLQAEKASDYASTAMIQRYLSKLKNSPNVSFVPALTQGLFTG